ELRLAVPTPDDVCTTFEQAMERVANSSCRAFSPVQLWPDNNLVTDSGLRFLDFEMGRVRSALLDAGHLWAPFVSSADALALPSGIVNRWSPHGVPRSNPSGRRYTTTTRSRRACSTRSCNSCGCTPGGCCRAWKTGWRSYGLTVRPRCGNGGPGWPSRPRLWGRTRWPRSEERRVGNERGALCA